MKKTIFYQLFIFLFLIIGCKKDELNQENLILDDISSVKGEAKNITVGQEYGGGIVVYIDASGKHGLILGKTDLGPAPWGCFGTLIEQSYDGQEMTTNIICGCNEPCIAARLCDSYIVRVSRSKNYKGKDKGKKYDDWFMPGSNEINLAGNNYHQNLNTTVYWTTSQAASFQAGVLNPANYVYTMTYFRDPANTMIGIPYYKRKDGTAYVRPMRKF